MDLRRPKSALAIGAICLTSGVAALGCGEEPGVEEPAREGLAIDVGGVDYNVGITRQLNLEIPPDEAFYSGPAAKPGHALYGVFIAACNPTKDTLTTTDDFVVEDNQGNEFEPIELPENNPFGYQSTELGSDDCAPEEGGIAQQGPLAASMLLFDFPIETTENRPLELIITAPEGESKRIELDL